MSARVTADGLRKKKKGPAPVHQNKFAFHHNKNSSVTAKIANIPNVGLCGKCHDIIEWKKQYRKYKARSVLGKWCVSEKTFLSIVIRRVHVSFDLPP
jgi:hypothetical protein